jgi:hypothetical protein
MPENDNSRPLADDSGRKTTSHVEGIGRPAGFFAQSSVLITFFDEPPNTDPEPWNPVTDTSDKHACCAGRRQVFGFSSGIAGMAGRFAEKPSIHPGCDPDVWRSNRNWFFRFPVRSPGFLIPVSALWESHDEARESRNQTRMQPYGTDESVIPTRPHLHIYCPVRQ